ncbi:response regulator [Halorarius halobius]|uniref:response regulator n=1 Tax=Halorarius halobius TaxID=2962671 RepID=UPI0020CC7971|nr:response regulator [Halorarius halobius]
MTPDDTIHVLLVDDDEELLETVGAMLRQHEGVVVTTEPSVPAALDTFDESFVDCIVSDYDMPGMDGLDFLTAVRWHSTDIPFIVTTAHGNERVASEAVRSGATDYILKEGDWVTELFDHVQSAVVARDEGKLAHASSRFQQAIDAIDGYAVVMLDRDGRVMTWNEGAERLTDRPATEIVGERVHDVFADGDALDEVLRTASDRGTAELNHDLVRAQGSDRPVTGQVTHVTGHISEPSYFAAVFH